MGEKGGGGIGNCLTPLCTLGGKVAEKCKWWRILFLCGRSEKLKKEIDPEG